MRISDWSSDVCSSDLLKGDVEAVLLQHVLPEVRHGDVLVPRDVPDGDGAAALVGGALVGGLRGALCGGGVVIVVAASRGSQSEDADHQSSEEPQSGVSHCVALLVVG